MPRSDECASQQYITNGLLSEEMQGQAAGRGKFPPRSRLISMDLRGPIGGALSERMQRQIILV
jgi:hypothetical protein